MPRGKNPDGTPKKYPADARRKAQVRRLRVPADSALTLTRDTPAVQQSWRQNPVIIRRLEMVERARLAGMTAYEISQAMGMPISTVLEDWQKLNDLWLDRTAATQEQLRGEAIRRLDHVIRNGWELLRLDEAYTQAVLFNMPVLVPCQGRMEHRTHDLLLGDPLGAMNYGATFGEVFSCIGPHQTLKRIWHDTKGSAQYRRIGAQVLQAINTALMNQARLQGLVVEKRSLTDAEGKDLPAALRTILLGEELPDVNALPSANGHLDNDTD